MLVDALPKLTLGATSEPKPHPHRTLKIDRTPCSRRHGPQPRFSMRPGLSHFIYATRSIIPSRAANAVQSANMACAFSDLFPSFAAIFRSPSGRLQDLPSVFAGFELPPPRNPHVVRARPSLDWSQTYLAAYAAFFRRQPAASLIYTRSGRLACTASLLGFETVAELHDPLIPPYAAWLRRRYRSRRSLKLVATTTRLKDDIVEKTGIPPDRILVAGGGANAALLNLPATPITTSFVFNVGYAGSAFIGKGLEVVVACAARLPDVGFHVIGPSADDCRRFGPVGPNLIIHGRKENREVIGLLKGMDCLLLPNQRSVVIASGADIGRHTSPLKMFEYMATGRPILASDLPVLSCTLRHAENALLVPPEDINAFCSGIRRLQQDPALGQRLGAQARAAFEASHSWAARARAIRHFIFA